MTESMENCYPDIRALLQEVENEDEKRRRFLQESPRGFVYSMLFPNNEKFEPMEMDDGTVRLIPNTQRIYLYRGQTKKYPTCVPKLYRDKPNEIDLFIERLKTTEFEKVLKTHPAVIDLAEDGLGVDFLGLSQHYGLKTDMIDLTSDIYVAAFFAVCEYNKDEGVYVPVTQRDGQCGVLYKSLNLRDQTILKNRVGVLGLQPFHRPGEQKAYTFRLQRGEDFEEYAHAMRFIHSKEASESIYERFEGGTVLFPDDPIEAKARDLRESRQFSKEAFDETHTRYRFDKPADYYLQRLELDHQMRIVEGNPHGFAESELENFKREWEDQGREEFYKQMSAPRLQYSG